MRLGPEQGEKGVNAVAEAAFVGVDWGTSSFRLWLMAADGSPLATRRSEEGMQHCAAGPGFPAVLEKHLAAVEAPAGLPVLICGMAGARQGWVEAAYLPTPAALADLAGQAIAVPVEGRDVRILPGIAHAVEQAPSVMRGEETQLLGAIAGADAARFSGLVCLPGTHCKWVQIEGGQVTAFSTFMTGELYALLSQQSILRHTLDPEAPAGSGEDPGFRDAVTAVQADPTAGWAGLFGLRAGQLLGFAEQAEGAARLSGLLVGAEIASARALYGAPGDITLLGSGRLGELYTTALAECGYKVRSVDAEEAVRQGLAQAAAQLWLEGASA